MQSSFSEPTPLTCTCPQVNDALNNLLIEEEDFEALKHSIQSYDNFDQVFIVKDVRASGEKKLVEKEEGSRGCSRLQLSTGVGRA